MAKKKTLAEKVEWVISHTAPFHCDSSEDAERTYLMWDIPIPLRERLPGGGGNVYRHYFTIQTGYEDQEWMVVRNYKEFPDLYEKLVDHNRVFTYTQGRYVRESTYP